jgi:hypothetical protein
VMAPKGGVELSLLKYAVNLGGYCIGLTLGTVMGTGYPN